jgi:hypothetical protein
VSTDGVIEWPDWYWEMVATVEGEPTPEVEVARVPWGPPA